MRVSEATRCFLDYHRMNSNTNTISNYELVLALFLYQGDFKTITENIPPDEHYGTLLNPRPRAPLGPVRGPHSPFRSR